MGMLVHAIVLSVTLLTALVGAALTWALIKHPTHWNRF
jgi:hypothetical protein